MTLVFNLLIVLLLAGQAYAYTPPVGIPDPSWGSIHPIDTPVPSRPDPWTTEQTGYYYVNPQSGTDTGRTYGTPTAPRATVPITIPAGSRVELTGTHTYARTFTAQGTEASPIFFVGTPGALPTITTAWYWGNAAYVIIDGLQFSVAKPEIRTKDGYTPNHICLRNSKITGNGLLGNTGSVNFYGASPNWTEHIVLYNNEVSYIGKYDYIGEDDRHAFKPENYSRNIWLLNSHHHHNGGDAVQVGNPGGVTATSPYNIYIGGNTFHDDGENAVDLKGCKDVIVSSNDMYSYTDWPGETNSFGPAVSVHDSPVDIWFINNRIHDAKGGIVSSGSNNLYIIGNVIYDMDEYATENHTDGSYYRSGYAIFAYSTKRVYVYNNTIYDTTVGVSYYMTGADYDIDIVGNIISNLRVGAVTGINPYSIILGTDDVSVAASDIEYNAFYSPVKVHLDGVVHTALSTLVSAGKCDDGGGSCLDVAPGLVNPPTSFALTSSSAAKDVGSTMSGTTPYSIFLASYGIDIKKDIAGATKPQNGVWDIGAYEYQVSKQRYKLGGAIAKPAE